MSFLISAGQAFVSGIESIGSALGSAFSSVANDVTGGLSSIANFIQQLPSDIANFFQSIAGAIISFAHTFGAYIWNGLQTIAHGLATVMAPVERAFEAFQSALIQAWITIWNDLKAFASGVVNFIVSTITGFISFVQPVINDIKNMFVDAYNFLVTVVSDIYAIFTTIANFFLDMPTFFQNVASFLNNLFTDPGNQPNLLTMIPNMIVSEVSRIAGAMPDVIGFNTFMELLPKIVYGIAKYPLSGSGLTGLLGKALLLMGSPFLTVLISSMTKSLIQSFFSSTQTTQTVPRPSQPQVQPPQNLPSVKLPQRSKGTASVSDLQAPQPSTLTPQQAEVQLERPNITGVFVQDVIGMGTPGGGTATLTSGYVVFQNAVQEFQDVFEIVPDFFMQLIESSQYEYSQGMTVDIALTLLENIYQVQQTVEIVPSVDATAIILPPDISFCNPNNVPQPSESASASSGSIDASATVQVQESLCIPPYDLLADTVTEFFGVISGVFANISDTIAESIQFASGIPYQTNLSDIITEAIQFASGIPFGTSLTDGVSLTVGFAPIAPSPESYTYLHSCQRPGDLHDRASGDSFLFWHTKL
jgi:hypothetical protein